MFRRMILYGSHADFHLVQSGVKDVLIHCSVLSSLRYDQALLTLELSADEPTSLPQRPRLHNSMILPYDSCYFVSFLLILGPVLYFSCFLGFLLKSITTFHFKLDKVIHPRKVSLSLRHSVWNILVSFFF